ncbi:MAG TPA: CBS domain-containing protein [Candidatus Saccharimonadales bacterium]
MVEILFVLVIILIACLLLVSAISVTPSNFSQFEIDRRIKAGEKETKIEQERARYYGDLLSLQRAAASLFLVLSVVTLVYLFGWIVGLLLAVLLALEYGAVSRLSFIRRQAQKLYEKYESQIINFIQRYPKIFSLLRVVTPGTADTRLTSREELQHLVSQAGTLLTHDEQLLIKSSLHFRNLPVSEVMTPRSVIDSVKKSEILGPLVLDDLHKTGHSRFPVIDQDMDHVVGVLHLRDLLTLDTTKKHTARVDTAMESRVFYIHLDQTLDHALAAFLKTRHHLFVVVNEYRETVGLLSLEDVIEALIGRKIVDEFDAHDDLRVVAARNPRKNNSHPKSQDV